MSGKGSRRRAGANDAAFKAAPWPPESPTLRKLNAANVADSCETRESILESSRNGTTKGTTQDGRPEGRDAQ